jgi:hypothetical protein
MAFIALRVHPSGSNWTVGSGGWRAFEDDCAAFVVVCSRESGACFGTKPKIARFAPMCRHELDTRDWLPRRQPNAAAGVDDASANAAMASNVKPRRL